MCCTDSQIPHFFFFYFFFFSLEQTLQMENEDVVGKIQRYSVPTSPNNMYMPDR